MRLTVTRETPRTLERWTAERVERPENILSWNGAMDMREFDVHELSRDTDLMRE